MTDEAIVIDGAEGEGGGQVLRSSLALSLVTGRPLRMHDIRAKRRRPGLMRQHLTAVRAATEIGGAEVEGDELRSTSLSFVPGTVRAGEYRFSVGTAGSTTLVLQTVLWPLLLAPGRSRVVLEGGTHNPMAPTYEFMARSLLPRLRAMGASLSLELQRAGFYPAGGGRLVAEIEGGRPLSSPRWLERGPRLGTSATAIVSNLRVSIARRELAVVGEQLGWPSSCLRAEQVDSAGPGNVLLLEVEHESGRNVIIAFGEKGVSAERVAQGGVRRMQALLHAAVPVDEHLADQLLVPLALAGGGAFRTTEPSTHTRTNAALVQRWMPVAIEIVDEGEGVHRVEVRPRG